MTAATITPQLDQFSIPFEDLVPNPDNPNEGDIGNMIKMFERVGQLIPIIVHMRKLAGKRAKQPYILAGHTRYNAAAHLEWDRLAATEFIGTVAEADAFALGDNRARDLATYNQPLLVSALTALAEEDAGLLTITGFDGDDLDLLIADLNRGDLDLSNLGDDTALTRDGATPADRYEDWEQSGVRSIIFPLALDVYDKVVDRMRDLRGEYEVDNNSELLVRLLDVQADE